MMFWVCVCVAVFFLVTGGLMVYRDRMVNRDWRRRWNPKFMVYASVAPPEPTWEERFLLDVIHADILRIIEGP